jgi:hypothetical protein
LSNSMTFDSNLNRPEGLFSILKIDAVTYSNKFIETFLIVFATCGEF